MYDVCAHMCYICMLRVLESGSVNYVSLCVGVLHVCVPVYVCVCLWVMCAWLCVPLCVPMYVMCTCVCICLWVMCACVLVLLHVCVCLCMCVMYTYLCVCELYVPMCWSCVCVCMHVPVYVYYVYISVYLSACMCCLCRCQYISLCVSACYVFLCVYYVYVCVCMCVQVYTWQEWEGQRTYFLLSPSILSSGDWIWVIRLAQKAPLPMEPSHSPATVLRDNILIPSSEPASVWLDAHLSWQHRLSDCKGALEIIRSQSLQPHCHVPYQLTDDLFAWLLKWNRFLLLLMLAYLFFLRDIQKNTQRTRRKWWITPWYRETHS